MNAELAKLLLRVERADTLIAEVSAGIKAYEDTKPHFLWKKVENGERIYYVTKTSPVQDTLAPVVGDAIHNLRTALDVLTWRLLTVAQGTEPDPKKWKVYFPIARSAADYMNPNRGHRALVAKGINPLAMNIIDAAEPYLGGRSVILWQLNELANINKHRLLLTAAASLWGVDMWSLIKGLGFSLFRV